MTLLQQLVAQTHSYAMTPGFVNSTTSPIVAPPPFQPSLNAIRVNVLWFASLLLGLMSASFGILVKQWLREYLAGEYTSSQARLRVRHFRNPGLADWKVFEVAAVLPVVLQLALALFFVGLCFFTADVHSSIGHTTIPLVAGWTFLFIAVTLAPTISPLCPYKTPLLNSAAKLTRRQLYKGISFICERTRRSLQVQIPSPRSYQILACDEADVVVDDKNDIDILVSVDSIQADDQLLKVMWGALQQDQVDPADMTGFLLKIISNRVQRDLTKTQGPLFFDLKSLPAQSFALMMSMAADVLSGELGRQVSANLDADFNIAPWMSHCMDLLLSETNFPLTNTANNVLSRYLSDGRHKVVLDLITQKFYEASDMPYLLWKLRYALLQMEIDDMLAAVEYLLQRYFCQNCNDTPAHLRLYDLVRNHPEIPSEHLQSLFEVLVRCPAAMTDSLWDPSHSEALNLLFELSADPGRRGTALKVVQSMLVDPTTLKLKLYCHYSQDTWLQEPLFRIAQDLFIDAIMAIDVLVGKPHLGHYHFDGLKENMMSDRTRVHLAEPQNDRL